MTLPDSTPWAGGAQSSPAPDGRDEAYEAWKRSDPRHYGVTARHAWNASWSAATEQPEARLTRLALNVLRSRSRAKRAEAERDEALTAIREALDFESVLPAIATVPRRILTDALSRITDKEQN